MDLFALTRALIDIDSTTGRERAVGDFLFSHLSAIAGRTGGRVERMPVSAERFNLFAAWGEPRVVLSTHIDTVPPFLPSAEDDEHIFGRGACDTKGGIAAMVKAIEALLASGESGFGLLFVVGEETDSVGATVADREPRGSRYLVNVGSVGDPGDGTSDASYCIFDSGTNSVSFRGVPFDLDAFRGDLASTGLNFTPWFLRAETKSDGGHVRSHPWTG